MSERERERECVGVGVRGCVSLCKIVGFSYHNQLTSATFFMFSRTASGLDASVSFSGLT